MKSVASVFLALQILFSSIGFSIDMHFCGGQLLSFSIFGNAEPCAHNVSGPSNLGSCPMHMTPDDQQKHCCDDRDIRIEAKDYECTAAVAALNFNVDLFSWIILVPPDHQINSEGKYHFSPYKNYKPPLIPHNLPVLYQSFLT